jgi:hypothetical protein
MKTLFAASLILLIVSCNQRNDPKPTTIALTYEQGDIQKAFDTLYNYQQFEPGIYFGVIEQALASCHRESSKGPVTQDVFSSMYLDTTTKVYDCVTTTTFRFPNGTIAASGVFNLVPGATIAPNHDFPITGGSGRYANIYGTYTRKYVNGVYYVKLRFYKQN